MIEPNLRLQKPLEDYVEYVEKMSPRSISLLGGLIVNEFSFQDPYHIVRGVQAAEALLQARFGLYTNGSYHVSDFAWGRREGVAYVYWEFSYLKKARGVFRKKVEKHRFEGVSEIVFDGDGNIVSHTEFWGNHDNFNVKAYALVGS